MERIPGWLPLLALLLIPAAPARAAIRLERWEQQATLIPNAGPGEQLYRLDALVSWPRARPGDVASFAIRAVLPDGTATTRGLERGEGPGSRRLTVYVPVRSVRNVRPERVAVRVSIVDLASNRPVSNELLARIDDFPTPDSGNPPADPGPFGWGRPLDPRQAQPLPRPGPDGLRFVRVPEGPEGAPFLIATTEATNRQVAARLPSYAPPSGRSDEFSLEAPDQPAFGLTPARAEGYLLALSRADRAGIAYRLPTRAEWIRAARAGRPAGFWWGDAAAYPRGANLLGPEPALAADATAPAAATFEPNPWGLRHTFGNVAEWATTGDGSFVRMGGHFRSEPPATDAAVGGRDEVGDDLFVGVRPAFSLTSTAASDLARKALSSDRRLAGVKVEVNADRLAARLSGEVAEPALRREADRRLALLWWLAAVENRMSTPTIPPGQLARLGRVAGAVRRRTVLGRPLDVVPVEVRWADRLPVKGSEWWVNVDAGPGSHSSLRLEEPNVGGRRVVPITIDRSAIAPGRPVTIYLSLGAPAATANDAAVVSNPATISVP